MDLYQIITLAIKQSASDIHLSSGQPLMLRINGRLTKYANNLLLPDLLEQQLISTLTTEQRIQFNQTGMIDYALSIKGIGRFRAHLFQQRLGLSAVYRIIPDLIPDLAQLDTPPILSQLVTRKDGLILITGATGSGKSTTLASIIQSINQTTACHIITLEDPIEFIHQSQCALIQQREIGVHVDSFSLALKSALRQDPDILLLGELRDPQTIRLALTAAETGHLVFATLHTRSAIQSIERIIDVFSSEEKAFVRAQLANSLQGVITQCLLAKPEGGRIAAFEVLVNTPAITHLIREGKTHQMMTVLQTGYAQGMQTMEQAIQQRVQLYGI